MSNQAPVESEYYQLSDLESISWKLNIFVIWSMTLLIGSLIIFVLVNHLKKSKVNKENEYYIYAIRCAVSSAFCTIILSITAVFFSNNYFIDIDYSVENNAATLADSIMNIAYFMGKILFYFGFTFHIQSALKEPMSGSLKLWMCLVAVAVVIFGIMFIYDDISVYSLNEVGVTSRNDVYLAMYILQQGFSLGNIAMSLFSVTDFIYFVVLTVYYIPKLKKANHHSKQGVKAIILVSTASIIFYICCIQIVINLPIKYIFAGLTVLFDDCCLFLMFKPGDEMYSNLCGCICHSCCSQLIYGSKHQNDTDDDQQSADREALLL